VIDADRLVNGSAAAPDEQVDRAIRPLSLADYIGQPVVREQMELFIQAARGRRKRWITP
jgi:holliday junction DNA helicase RuvB